MTNNSKIRVLLVDDHPVVRAGLQFALEQASGLTVIGQAESGEEAIFIAKKITPDIIIMDMQMDGLNGVETAEIILRKMPDIKIIGLSSYVSKQTSDKFMEIGGSAFLLKDASADEITSTIRKVNSGMVCTPTHSQESGEEPAHKKDTNISSLGVQQYKVLALMTKGFTNPEIAEDLKFSVPTARYHVSVILNKLKVSNRSEAVAVAIRDNLIKIDKLD